MHTCNAQFIRIVSIILFHFMKQILKRPLLSTHRTYCRCVLHTWSAHMLCINVLSQSLTFDFSLCKQICKRPLLNTHSEHMFYTIFFNLFYHFDFSLCKQICKRPLLSTHRTFWTNFLCRFIKLALYFLGCDSYEEFWPKLTDPDAKPAKKPKKMFKDCTCVQVSML